MSDHPDLVALLRGELSNADVIEAAEHLDGCAECRQELAETAVGHALLTGTTRTLGEPGSVEVREVPPPLTPPARGRAWLRPVGLVAAAAALIVGTAVVTQWVDGPSARPPVVAVPERTADLRPVDGTGSGRVVMAEDTHDGVQMTVETRDLPKAGDDEFYEAWLLDPKTQKMLPLGVVGPAGKASFDVPVTLVGRYQEVDVSLERDDGNPAHSVTSVLRASYA